MPRTNNLSYFLFCQIDEVSLLQQYSAILQIDLVSANKYKYNSVSCQLFLQNKPCYPGGREVAGLSWKFRIQYIPQAVPGQQLAGVGVGEERHPALRHELGQLLRHHAAAPQVHLHSEHQHQEAITMAAFRAFKAHTINWLLMIQYSERGCLE